MNSNAKPWLLAGVVLVAAGVAALMGEEPGARGDSTPPVVSAEPPPAAPPADPGALRGRVAEVIHVDNYTYLRLEDERWAAVTKAAVAVGDEVEVVNAAMMRGFQSKTLNRTFSAIYFGQLAGDKQAPPSTASVKSLPSPSAEKPVAPLRGGTTVADVIARAEELEGQKVSFAARVTKVTANVLDKTWLHVTDGSRDESGALRDLVVTTQAVPDVGAVLTVTGVLARNKDLGSGYRYDVLIEQAELSDPKVAP